MEPAQEERDSSTLNTEPSPVVVRRESERDLVVWSGLSRPFMRRDRQFYVTIFAIAGIVGLVLFLAEGLMPVLLIAALVFLYYVLSTVEPETIEYKVTNKGIKVAGRLTNWSTLGRFWFSKRFNSELLILETFALPGRMEIVINPEIKDSLKREISAFLPFEEVPASGLEKVTNWLGSKLPGNR